MRFQGRITSWKDDKGFGFITPNGGGDQVFFHISAFKHRKRRPQGEELVIYELTQDDNGRPRARAVVFVGEQAASNKPRQRSRLPIIFLSVFLLFLLALVVTGHLPIAIPGLYLLTSVAAFVAYAVDKSAARRDQWRTQESTLHLLALLGGWPGALMAQRLLRHKSSKEAFQTVFWLTVILNCAGLMGLLTPAGSAMLNNFLGG